MALDNSSMAALAAIRFGLGARPGEIAARRSDPQGSLLKELKEPAALGASPVETGLPDAQAAMEVFREYQMAQRARREVQAASQPNATQAQAQMAPGAAMASEAMMAPDRPAGPPVEVLQRQLNTVRELAGRELNARLQRALTTTTPFADRLTYFWANHFTIAATKLQTTPFVGLFERSAIRPNITGTFYDLLLASTQHPGMLTYLDNFQSFGPNSQLGRGGRRGLNENLAREILELHTLGADGGYTQADVTEFARALTGWTVYGPQVQRQLQRVAPQAAQSRRLGDFVFIGAMHEPGPRTIMGKTYAQEGQAQAQAILADLAIHPATARRLATKFAKHFQADAPDPALVSVLQQAYLNSGGNLGAMTQALVQSPLAWSAQLAKVKTPWELYVSTLRAIGVEQANLQAARTSLDAMGQQIFRAASPEGWPDDAASWTGPDAIMKRIEWADAVAQRVESRLRPLEVADIALGSMLDEPARTAIMRAESARQAFTLLIMSPSFQRR